MQRFSVNRTGKGFTEAADTEARIYSFSYYNFEFIKVRIFSNELKSVHADAYHAQAQLSLGEPTSSKQAEWTVPKQKSEAQIT